MRFRSYTTVSAALLFAAIAVGLYARFYALGQSPLAIDEYYLAQSIRNILESGFPRFDCGGYYVRGLVQQYLTTGLTLLGLDMHVALRLVTVLANVAAIPAVYLLAKRLSGTTAAVVACILFSLSIWEIEMARFGRMYAPFQAVFVWYCIALCHAYLRSQRGFYASIILGTATIFVYEGAALLLCTTFIPLLAGKIQGVKNWILAGGSLVFGAWFITQSFGGTDDGAQSPDSPEIPTSAWNLPIDEPLAPFSAVLSKPLVVLMLAGAVALTIFVSFKMYRSFSSRERSAALKISYLWLGLTIWLAASGLFGIIIMVSAPLLVWRWFQSALVNRTALFSVCTWLIITLAVWIVSLLQVADGTISERGVAIVYMLFLYPDVYSEVAYRWIRSLPVESIVAVVSISSSLLVMRKVREEPARTELFFFLIGLLLVLFFLVAILPQPYSSIRYTYFLHPLVIVLVAASWTTIVTRLTSKAPLQTLVVLGATLVLMVASVDYRLNHIRNIATPQILYRTAMSKWDVDRVYRRWDYRSPAEYVNAHAAPSEQIVTTSHSVPYYLSRLTHFYASSEGKEFTTIAACQETKERWSFGDLLSSPEELRRLHEAGSQSGLWAIIRSPEQPEGAPIEKEIAREYSSNIVHWSDDKRLIVVHIPSVNPQTGSPR